MTPSAPETARMQHRRAARMRGGVVLAFTIVRHPPSGFPGAPRTIGLIELDDGPRVLGQLIVPEGTKFAIGARVRPRMRLSRINDQELRIYDAAYELTAQKPVRTRQFSGYILALTGPSGVGKSTVSKLMTTKIGDCVEQVPILTTRASKNGDDDEYTYVTTADFAAMQSRGEIVAATNIPSETEKRWYGYRAADIEAIWKRKKLPIVITEMHLLQGLASHFGRRSILSFGLLPPGRSKRQMLSSLLHRMRTRGRETEVQITERIRNAELDLAFFTKRKELFNRVLVNDDLDIVFGALKAEVMEVVKA